MIFILRRCRPCCLLLLLLMTPLNALAERVGAYDYPFVDPLVATVVETPEANRVTLPRVEDGRELRRFNVKVLPERKVPPVFFFERHGLEFGLWPQPKPAPLVFVIAGTGASFEADINRRLATLLWADGNHVIALPSPTHTNFIVNASTTGVPGRLQADAVDLHRAMRAAYQRVAGRIVVTGFSLAGYSLGASHAAFVARHDETMRSFNFDRVLLLNPAVSLFTSIGLVDDMLDRFVEDDPNAIRDFVERAYGAFARLYVAGAPTEFAGDFLYRLYAALEPSGPDLEKLIGLAFRLSAANLSFASDVITESGFLVPPGSDLRFTDSLTDIYLKAQRHSFMDYFENLYFPYHARAEPGLSRERMIADADLRAIEDYLAEAGHIGLLTNEDDIILAPDDLAFLERVFAGRSTIYPTGGHCGNYLQHDVAARIQGFFKGEWETPDAGERS